MEFPGNPTASEIVVGAAFAESEGDLAHAMLTAESLRTFGGRLGGSQFRIHGPTSFPDQATQRTSSAEGSTDGSQRPDSGADG